MLYGSCDWNWVLVFKRDWEWIGNLRAEIDPLDGLQELDKWNSSPPFNSAPPQLAQPPISFLLLGCCVYKRRGHSVLQVSLVRLGVLATLKLNPSYLCKA